MDKEVFLETINRALVDDEFFKELCNKSDAIRRETFGNKVYIRGLIEYTNYCRKDCLYCGIRCSNNNINRYRLTEDEILSCCKNGYELGFRTFVLQGGEDIGYDDHSLTKVIEKIKSLYPDCAITLSCGERSKDIYEEWFSAGADRYLLRHESACEEHYSFLHPKGYSLSERKKCLYQLKEIGYQTGAGMMIGSPRQSLDMLYEDLIFLEELEPHMIGTGPFIPHRDTVFADIEPGSVRLTLIILCIIRSTFPKVLLPSTTALSTLSKDGRISGIKAGANVIMPNLSFNLTSGRYDLYEGKTSKNLESGKNIEKLKQEFINSGYEIVVDRGDYCSEET